jgi:hypothetical protein
MQHFIIDALGRGGGIFLIGLFAWLGPCLLTDYRKKDIPEKYR